MKKSIEFMNLCRAALFLILPIMLIGRDSLTVVAKPIEDYIQLHSQQRGTRDFLTGIHDLLSFENLLYIGYGDANLNLGRITPIEIRVYDGEKVLSEFTIDEEQIDHFRRLDSILAIPGVDATEDAWLGNVYLKIDGSWQKYRSVPNGVHVHDIALWQNNIYAVGSGSSMDEWNNGMIYGHLWKMEDDSFVIADRIPNAGSGDCRFISLMPLDDRLLIFGYRTNPEFSGIDSIFHLSWTGDSLEAFDFPNRVFIRSTWPSGYVLGVDMDSEKQRLFQITDTLTSELPIKDGWELVDISAPYLMFSKKDSIRITEPGGIERVLHFDDKPLSIGMLQGDIFIGSKRGILYRLDK